MSDTCSVAWMLGNLTGAHVLIIVGILLVIAGVVAAITWALVSSARSARQGRDGGAPRDGGHQR